MGGVHKTVTVTVVWDFILINIYPALVPQQEIFLHGEI